MARLVGLIVLVLGGSLAAVFECPRECSCSNFRRGLDISCYGLRDITLPNGFVNNANGVSGISLYGDNITIGEDAFAHISCGDGGTFNIYVNMVEIRQNGFYDIDGCRFNIYGFIGLMAKRSFSHIQNMPGFTLYGDMNTVSTEAFDDITGAGTCSNINFGGIRIERIEHHGFSNIRNFRSIRLSNTRVGELGDNSFYNMSHIQRVDFSYSQFGKILPYAFAGLHCCGRFELSYANIENLSNNAFSGMRNITTLSFDFTSADSAGINLFSDIHGVVTFSSSFGLSGNLDAGSLLSLTEDHPCEFFRTEYPPCKDSPDQECYLNVPCQPEPTATTDSTPESAAFTTKMGPEGPRTTTGHVSAAPESTPAFTTKMGPEGPRTTTGHVSAAPDQSVGVLTLIGILAPILINMNEV